MPLLYKKKNNTKLENVPLKRETKINKSSHHIERNIHVHITVLVLILILKLQKEYSSIRIPLLWIYIEWNCILLKRIVELVYFL